MSPVVNVAAASAPPRNSSNIASSKARSHSARSYLHKQYLKVGLNRLQKRRPKGGLKSTLIHPSDPWPLPGHPEAMKMGCRGGYFHTVPGKRFLRSRTSASRSSTKLTLAAEVFVLGAQAILERTHSTSRRRQAAYGYDREGQRRGDPDQRFHRRPRGPTAFGRRAG